MNKVLLIDDEPSVAESVQHVLKGYKIVPAASAAEGLAAASSDDFQVVVVDLKMPGADGLEVVQRLHASRPRLPVILMTGFDSPEAAIEAMKLGAYDYIVKPDKLDDWPGFLDLLERAVRNSRLMSEPVEVGKASFSRDAIIGRSHAMQEVYKQIGLVAARPVTVLIRGETGTGKELVARAIYQHSDRAKRPFIVVDCVAIREHLLESELFGSESGAFTDAKAQRIGRFEQANHGTIFLNEIGEMNSSMQARLLRVLQDRVIQRLGGKATIMVDVRIIAATHRNLELAVKENQFREDLYYWLKDLVITLPPLRERREDIPEWVKHFIQRYAAELGSSMASMPTADAMAFLKEQPWP